MIISASRRTDIPAFFSEWLIERLKAGYVNVKNPMTFKQVSKVILDPAICDCIIFWTKNPIPLMDKLDTIEQMGFTKYYFQFTLNPYNTNIEKNLPQKDKIINAFLDLSARLGKERVIWRYDPIILNSSIGLTKEYHYRQFEKLVKLLSGKTEKCIISFLDNYKKVKENLKSETFSLNSFDANDIKHKEIMIEITREFLQIIKRNNSEIKLECCAEPILLEVEGVTQAHCIDLELIERINGKMYDKNNMNKQVYQRTDCGCAKSYDIGAMNTCLNGCLYCYATDCKQAKNNFKKYDINSDILCSTLIGDEKIFIKNEKNKIESEQLMLDL